MSGNYPTDGPDLDEPLPPEIINLLEKGRAERTIVLPGTERPNKGINLYAQTFVEIEFKDEENLKKCVKLLYWSDQRLSRLPALLARWDWQKTERQGMTILFSTGWYEKEFFEERNNAFLGREHASYYSKFGANPDDLKVRHEIYGTQ